MDYTIEYFTLKSFGFMHREGSVETEI